MLNADYFTSLKHLLISSHPSFTQHAFSEGMRYDCHNTKH